MAGVAITIKVDTSASDVRLFIIPEPTGDSRWAARFVTSQIKLDKYYSIKHSQALQPRVAYACILKSRALAFLYFYKTTYF